MTNDSNFINTVDSALSSSSENPVQNKVIKNALDGKLDTTDVFATWSYSNGNLEIPNVYSSDIDSSLSSTSENPVQNKVINSALDEKIPKSGGAVISGDELCRTVNTSRLSVRGGTDTNGGASIVLYGKDWADNNYKGLIALGCYNGSDDIAMRLYANGTLTWGSKNIAMQEDTIPRSGGAVLSGVNLSRTVNNSELSLEGGTSWYGGARIVVEGRDKVDGGGGLITLIPYNGSNYYFMRLYPNGSWTWDGSACQITSDERYKQQIAEIDDKLLDAWEDVNPVQFKYNESVNTKKDKARLHTGYVVQQIDEACKSHDVDISEYGLYCHEEYPERTEEVTIENEDGTTKKETKVIEEAKEHYSLRYTEALIVECAYLRKKNKQLQEQIYELSARLDKLEKGNNVK